MQCPNDGSVCVGGTTETQAATGYWLYQALSSDGSTGTNPTPAVSFLQCSPVEACVQGNTCAVGYQGALVRTRAIVAAVFFVWPRTTVSALLCCVVALVCCVQCSQCIPKAAYRNPFSTRGSCATCPSMPLQRMGIYLVGTAVVALLLYVLRHYEYAVASYSVVLEFMQVLSIVGTVEVSRGSVSQWMTFLVMQYIGCERL